MTKFLERKTRLRLESLLIKLIDESLSRSESDELVSILSESEEARAYYLSHIEVHSQIAGNWDAGCSVSKSVLGNERAMAEESEKARRSGGFRFKELLRHVLRTPWASAALILVCVGLSLIAFISVKRLNLQGNSTLAVAENNTDTSETQDVAAKSISFVAFRSDLVRDAAVVVRVSGVTDDEYIVGRRLQPGTFKISHGEVQLEFMNGAMIAVEGPAELQIESKDTVNVLSGKIGAYVPERAHGFTINAPSAAVIDLGTEFAMNVDETGASEVEVISGEVELSLLGDDGNTLFSRRVRETGSIRADRQSKSLSETASGKIIFPRVQLHNDTPLIVGEDYADLIRQHEPTLYWRFENADDSIVKNEMGELFSGTIHRSDDDPDSLMVDNGHLTLRRTNSQRYVIMEEAIKGLNRKAYTIEFWMKPDDLTHSTCLGFFPVFAEQAAKKLNVIEIATDTNWVHSPGAIRFLDRYPPAQSPTTGTNIFSAGLCTPGQWQHVVVQKNDQGLDMYFNGQLVSHVDRQKGFGSGDFRMIVGQLSLREDERFWRQFAGSIDELAVYQRTLTSAEIESHYKLIAEQR